MAGNLDYSVMYRNYSLLGLRPVTPIHIALGTFLLLWVVMFAGLAWGNSGLMPASLMAVFNFVFVDVLYLTGWRLWIGLLPDASPIGFYTASSIGYSILAVLVAAWFHVLNIVRRPAEFGS